jgi:hypothetical protein
VNARPVGALALALVGSLDYTGRTNVNRQRFTADSDLSRADAESLASHLDRVLVEVQQPEGCKIGCAADVYARRFMAERHLALTGGAL